MSCALAETWQPATIIAWRLDAERGTVRLDDGREVALTSLVVGDIRETLHAGQALAVRLDASGTRIIAARER